MDSRLARTMLFSRLLKRGLLNLQNIRRVDPNVSTQSDLRGLDVRHRTIFVVDDDKFRKFEEWLNSPFKTTRAPADCKL